MMKSNTTQSSSFISKVLPLAKASVAFLTVLAFFSFLITSCGDGDDTPEITAPIVTTDTIYETTDVSAVLGGKITSDGGSEVTAKGICWDVNADPTMDDDTVMLGKGIKDFSKTISGLTKNTKYYVRAFATNAIGTTYGTQKTFTTGVIVDVDGNSYTYITIGSQVWMVENLKVTRYRNGEKIPFVGANADWAKLSSGAFAYTNNEKTNTALHGLVYNWSAANSSNMICPKGWRLPTIADFDMLGDELLGTSVAGGKMKQAGLTNWDSPNQGADNSSKFNAVGSGMRDMDGTFKDFKAGAYFWTSTPKDAVSGNASYVTKDLASLLNKAYDKKVGFTIRCIKK